MKSLNWFWITGVCVAITVLAVIAIILPSSFWNAPAVVAGLLLILSMVAPAVIVPGRAGTGIGSGDAAATWRIGPLAAATTLLVVIAVAALVLAIHQARTLSWAAIAVWVGALIVETALIRGASSIVEDAAAQTGPASGDPRTGWQQAVQRASRNTENVVSQQRLEALSEKIRFSANDNGSNAAPENAAVTAEIGKIGGLISNPDGLAQVVRAATNLLEDREQAVRARRSRA